MEGQASEPAPEAAFNYEELQVMEEQCKRCGSPVASEQAFCPKCGAVIGMSDAARSGDDASWNMAATMVGQKLPVTPPPSRPPAQAPARPPASNAGQRAEPAHAQGIQAKASNNTMMLLAIVGFVAVLLIGGLLLLLLWLSL